MSSTVKQVSFTKCLKEPCDFVIQGSSKVLAGLMHLFFILLFKDNTDLGLQIINIV